MRRYLSVAVVALAVVFALSYAVPAVGGPQAVSSANPVKIAKRALKTAKSAKRDARRANRRASQALNKVGRSGSLLGATVQEVASPVKAIPPGAIDSHSVACPAGTVVISGGWTLISGAANAFWDHKFGNGWSVGVSNFDAISTNADITVFAICAPTGNAVLVRSARADRQRDERLLQQQRARERQGK